MTKIITKRDATAQVADQAKSAVVFLCGWRLLYFFSIMVLQSSLCWAVNCNSLDFQSALFCNQVEAVVKGDQCTRNEDYCPALAALLRGGSCKTSGSATPAEQARCYFLSLGYSGDIHCQDKERNYLSENHLIEPQPSHCNVGHLLRKYFGNFNEKKRKITLTDRFQILSNKNCRLNKKCLSPIQQEQYAFQNQVEAKTEVGPHSKECSVNDARKITKLCVESYDVIKLKTGRKISPEMLVNLFSRLTQGIEANRNLLHKERPRFYNVGQKIGDFTLPCAIQTRADSDEIYIYLQELHMKTLEGAEFKVEVNPIGVGNFKEVNLAITYNEPRLMAKADIYGAFSEFQPNHRSPLSSAQIERAKEEFEVANIFRDSPYIANAEAFFLNGNVATSIQPYYPISGSEIYSALHFASEKFTEGVSRENFIADFALKVFEGLEEFHKKGFVHRDIKPGNILAARDNDGNIIPKIIDFGLAIRTTASKEGTKSAKHTKANEIVFQQTSPGGFAGDITYLSPEYLEAISNWHRSASSYGAELKLERLKKAAAGNNELSEMLEDEQRFHPFDTLLSHVQSHLVNGPKKDSWSSALSIYEILHGGLPAKWKTNRCPKGVKNYQHLNQCGINCLAWITKPALNEGDKIDAVLCRALNPDPVKRPTVPQIIDDLKNIVKSFHQKIQYPEFTKMKVGRFLIEGLE